MVTTGGAVLTYSALCRVVGREDLRPVLPLFPPVAPAGMRADPFSREGCPGTPQPPGQSLGVSRTGDPEGLSRAHQGPAPHSRGGAFPTQATGVSVAPQQPQGSPHTPHTVWLTSISAFAPDPEIGAF